MARNKYPEQTIEKILDAATRLFVEKGFDRASIQDILDETRLSKGAVYHHFSSKEDILRAVIQRSEQRTNEFLMERLAAFAGNARERLAQLLHALADSSLSQAQGSFTKLQFQNPLFFMSGVQRNMKNDAPVIAGLIREGNRDGSMHAAEPDMVAEVLLMLFNVWSNPVLFGRDAAATEARLVFLQKTVRDMGVDVFSDALIQKYMAIYAQSGMFENQ